MATKTRYVSMYALTLALMAPAAAQATDQEPGVVRQMLEEICGSGGISSERCVELREQADREAAALEAEVATPAVSEGEPTWGFKWSNGFKLERSDKAFALKFGGRIMNDFAWISLSEGAESATADIDDPVDGTFSEGFGAEFRRARIFFSGTVYERLFFKSQFDFAGGDVDFKDVYMGLKFDDGVSVQVGHFKEPFSLDQLTSSKYITFMERSLADAFAPGRNTGGLVHVSKERWTWAASGTVITDDTGDRDSLGFKTSDAYNVTTRLTGLPVYADEGRSLVHLGAAYSHQFRSGVTPFDFESEPEVHLADDIVSTGALPGNNGDLLGLEFAAVLGPFSLQSEYILADVQPDVYLHGVYVEASYFLTGENRVYDTKKAVFGRVKPNNNFGSGGCGAWQLAGRFSRLDLDDRFVQGGTLYTATAGLNWYLFPNARVMANYVFGQLDDGNDLSGHMHTGQLRFQVDF